MWTTGKLEINGEEVKYCLKHFEESSIYGIDEGRISKLELRMGYQIVANYDRGWDVEPANEIAKTVLQQLLETYN